MRYRFDELFTENQDGSLTPKKTIRIGAATFGPSVTFRPGVIFSGVNIFDFKGCAIEAEEDPTTNILSVKGFYK